MGQADGEFSGDINEHIQANERLVPQIINGNEKDVWFVRSNDQVTPAGNRKKNENCNSHEMSPFVNHQCRTIVPIVLETVETTVLHSATQPVNSGRRFRNGLLAEENSPGSENGANSSGAANKGPERRSGAAQ